MPFVLDASMTMAWCFADEGTRQTRSVLAELVLSYAEVPALWMVEVVNVLTINERKRRITPPGSEEFLQILTRLDIQGAS